MVFDWDDFIVVLNPSVIAMTAVIGLAFGFIVARLNTRGSVLFYWMAASGVTFFVPLAIERFLQDAEIWERWFSALVLWLIYSGMGYVGSRLHRLVFTRKP